MRLFSTLSAKLPANLGEKLAPVSAKLDLAFSDDGPRSQAARAALLTFAVRVLEAPTRNVSGLGPA